MYIPKIWLRMSEAKERLKSDYLLNVSENDILHLIITGKLRAYALLPEPVYAVGYRLEWNLVDAPNLKKSGDVSFKHFLPLNLTAALDIDVRGIALVSSPAIFSEDPLEGFDDENDGLTWKISPPIEVKIDSIVIMNDELFSYIETLIKSKKTISPLKKQFHEKLLNDLQAAEARLLEIKKDPYKFSKLASYFRLETWRWKDALLLLAGAYPTGALVNWNGYENFMGVHIDVPQIINVAFIDASLPSYEVPEDYEFNGDEEYFKGDEIIELKIRELRELQYRLEFLYNHWVSAASPHGERNSPKFYLDWTNSKGYQVPWLDYAICEKLYLPKKSTIFQEKPLTDKERESMVKIIHSLAENGYRYPSHGSIKEMLDDFELNGNGVSEKTLKKYLDEFDKL